MQNRNVPFDAKWKCPVLGTRFGARREALGALGPPGVADGADGPEGASDRGGGSDGAEQQAALFERRGYSTRVTGLDGRKCAKCGTELNVVI